jgi:hypothetical protein
MRLERSHNSQSVFDCVNRSQFSHCYQCLSQHSIIKPNARHSSEAACTARHCSSCIYMLPDSSACG